MTDSGDQVRCPKCGHDGAGISRNPDPESFEEFDPEEPPWDFGCMQCGYAWAEIEDGGDSSSSMKGDSHELSSGGEPPKIQPDAWREIWFLDCPEDSNQERGQEEKASFEGGGEPPKSSSNNNSRDLLSESERVQRDIGTRLEPDAVVKNVAYRDPNTGKPKVSDKKRAMLKNRDLERGTEMFSAATISEATSEILLEFLMKVDPNGFLTEEEADRLQTKIEEVFSD